MSKINYLKNIYHSNASKAHKTIGELLESSPYFSNMRFYQEYPVNKIYPYYDSGREKFDWVILDIQVIIEMNGQHHYQPVRYGGISLEEAEIKLKEQIVRDAAKKNAAIAAGYAYVVFKYDEDITMERLFSKMEEAFKLVKETGSPDTIKYIRPDNTYKEIVIDVDRARRESDKHKASLLRQSEYRKRLYKIQKEKKSDRNK